MSASILTSDTGNIKFHTPNQSFTLEGDVKLVNTGNHNQIIRAGNVDLGSHKLTLESTVGDGTLFGLVGWTSNYTENDNNPTVITGDANSALILKAGASQDAGLGYGIIDITAGTIDITGYRAIYATGGAKHTLSAKDITISSDKAGIYADNSVDKGGVASVSIKDFDTLTVNAKETGVVANGGTVNFNGKNVYITSTTAGGIASLGGTTSIKASNELNITANVTDSNADFKEQHAIAIESGSVTLDAAKLNITVNGVDNADAIHLTGGELNIESQNATINGNVTNAGALNLKGITVFNDKVSNAGVITIGQGVTFFKGGLMSGTPARALFATGTTGIKLYGGTLVLEGTGNYINTLTGEGALQLNTLGFEIGNNQVNALNVTVSGEINEAINGNYSEILEKFNTDEKTQGKQIAQLTLTEGNTTNGAVITFNEQGQPVVHVVANATMSDMLEMGAATANAVTRTLQNDVRKRLGDLRSADAQNGAWVRYDGGRMSGQHTATKFNTLQMGYDTVAFRDNVRVGASLSYTRGDTDLRRGSADVDTYSFAMYGTWMGENGMFADVIARVANVKNDMTFAGAKTGKLENMAYAISGEFGQRFDVAQNFFVEPQVEVSYTYIDSDDVRLTGVSSAYKFDSVDSLIGRAGVVAGWTCPNQKGHVYARASVLREFMGDSEVTAGSNKLERDGQDTWAEIGLGAQYNINKNAYVWADVERTQGADINEDFRGTVGVRFNF